MTKRVRMGLVSVAVGAAALAGCATDDAGSTKKGSCCSDSSAASCCDSGSKSEATTPETKAESKPQTK